MDIWIQKDNQQWGPYSVEEVNQYLADGLLLPTDEAWRDGMDSWVPVAQIEGITLRLDPAGAITSYQVMDEPTAPPPATIENDSSQYYFIDSNNEQFGPIGLKALISFQDSGIIHAQSLVLKEGETRWQTLDSIDGIQISSQLRPRPDPIVNSDTDFSLVDISIDNRSVSSWFSGEGYSFSSIEEMIRSISGVRQVTVACPVKNLKFGLKSNKLKKQKYGSILAAKLAKIELIIVTSLLVLHEMADGIGEALGLSESQMGMYEMSAYIGAGVVIGFKWLRKFSKGILKKKLGNIIFITEDRFFALINLGFHKKTGSFSFEEGTSISLRNIKKYDWNRIFLIGWYFRFFLWAMGYAGHLSLKVKNELDIGLDGVNTNLYKRSKLVDHYSKLDEFDSLKNKL